jgi:hypothetical protein
MIQQRALINADCVGIPIQHRTLPLQTDCDRVVERRDRDHGFTCSKGEHLHSMDHCPVQDAMLFRFEQGTAVHICEPTIMGRCPFEHDGADVGQW